MYANTLCALFCIILINQECQVNELELTHHVDLIYFLSSLSINFIVYLFIFYLKFFSLLIFFFLRNFTSICIILKSFVRQKGLYCMDNMRVNNMGELLNGKKKKMRDKCVQESCA